MSCTCFEPRGLNFKKTVACTVMFYNANGTGRLVGKERTVPEGEPSVSKHVEDIN
jgi:hypothetical protein